MSFEEYVMFNALSEAEKKELAEKFAAKRLTPEQIKIGRSMATSNVSTWAATLA